MNRNIPNINIFGHLGTYKVKNIEDLKIDNEFDNIDLTEFYFNYLLCNKSQIKFDWKYTSHKEFYYNSEFYKTIKRMLYSFNVSKEMVCDFNVNIEIMFHNITHLLNKYWDGNKIYMHSLYLLDESRYIPNQIISKRILLQSVKVY